VTLHRRRRALYPEQLQLINQKIDVGTIDIDLLRQVVEGERTRRSSVSPFGCIRISIDQNPDLQIVRYEPLKSEADILTARGEFDPVASETATYVNASEEASPEYKVFGGISAITAERTNSDTAISGKLQTGTMYNLSFDLSKNTSTYTLLRSQYSGGMTFTLSQPFLKRPQHRGEYGAHSHGQKARQGAEAKCVWPC